MTISTAAAKLSYAGNGSTVDFAITWVYIAKNHVVATLRDAAGVETLQILDTDYSLTDPDTSGTLTMVNPPLTNETLVITSEPPNTQETDIPLGGNFPARAVEDALDVASQVSQKVDQKIDRSLIVPKTDLRSGSDLEIPNETDRALRFLTFDSDGKPIVTAVAPIGGAIVTPFAETYLDDTTQAATLATLGALGLVGGTLTGALNHAATVTVASATSTPIGAAASNNVDISGTTQIDGHDTVAAGRVRWGRFTGILQLTHNGTSMILPNNGANITTAVNDRYKAVSLGSGNWLYLYYIRADGTALSGSVVIEATDAEMETGTSDTVFASPANLGEHLQVPKCQLKCGVAGDILGDDDINITGVNDDGAGAATVTLGIDFEDANYICLLTVEHTVDRYSSIDTQLAGSVILNSWRETTNPTDPISYHFVAWGKQV